MHDGNDKVGPRRLFPIATGPMVEEANSPISVEK
jgi:hypothetical protein